MAERLVSPEHITGRELHAMLTDHWPEMERTRKNAAKTDEVIAGDDAFVLPETFTIAGAAQYIAQIPHPQTVPQRVLQKVIARRPDLGIPLGPKGLGITAQRLTTRVEEPLNAICKDKRAGFAWEAGCAAVLFHGWAASLTVIDPASWERRSSPWSDGTTSDQWAKLSEDEKDSKEYAKAYRRDAAGRTEDQDGYEGVDKVRSKNAYELSMGIYRARNLPLKHRIVTVHNAAPIFGPDLSVEGLIISQEFSTSWLRRNYDFGEAGVATPTGGTAHAGNTLGSTSSGRGTLTLIEGWLYDEDGEPYVTYCVKGKGDAVEARWKGRGSDYDGKNATLNLKERFGLERLPIAWGWGLGNPAESRPDRRSMGFLDPFIQGWQSVRAKMTANNVAIMFASYPVLIEVPQMGGTVGTIDDEQPTTPDIQPMKITHARPNTTLEQLKLQAVHDSAFKQIELELGANADESPGKSNKDQSGFSQSMAEGFEELALTTVHETLGELYEAHGSFVLEAGKRLPEMGRHEGAPGSGYAPIMVFASTDVPVNDNPDRHNEPMELDPDLIDETFTTKANYTKSMSIPEEQQSMEAVERNLKTRRQHLEDTGDTHPEETELELLLERIRAEPAWMQYAMKLMAQVQGSEELEELTRAKDEGLADDDGMPMGLEAGVAPAPPPGMPPMMPEGGAGVPVGGSVTGMSPPAYGPAALAGAAAGGTMAAPIANVVAAGGTLPPNLPGPGGV